MFEKLLVEWSMTEDAQKILGKHDEAQDWALLAFASWLDTCGRTTHEADAPIYCQVCGDEILPICGDCNGEN